MALPPAAVPMSAAAGTASPADMAPDAGADEGATEPKVFATIMKNSDGTYTLIPGDEPEEAEAGAVPGAGAGPLGESAATAATPAGKTFDTPQALVEGVMNLLEGGDSTQKSFDDGFNGGSDASPAKASPLTA